MRVRGVSAACVSVVVGVACLSASPLPAFGATDIGNLQYAGERSGGTRLKFPAGDAVEAQVDVGSGNLLVSVKGIALQGVKTQIQTGAFYNSVAVTSIGESTRLGRGWGLDYTPSISVKKNTDNSVTYTGPGGLTGLFPLKSGSTTSYKAPDGFTVDLDKTSTGWAMTDHGSQQKSKFNTAGDLVSRTDRDGNVTAVNSTGTSGGFPNLSIVAPAGPTAGRTMTVSTDTYATTTMKQNVGAESRQVSFSKVYGNMTSFTDALGRSTGFSYDAGGRITSINAPGSVGTRFGYDSSGRVVSVSQVETAAGGPGTGVTRLAYQANGTDPAQTLVADPSTDQAQAVSAVPHATYTLKSDKRVDKAEDAEGRKQEKTYNPVNMATQTGSVGSGSSASSVTNTFGANNGESLTKSVTNGGLEMSMSYANTSGPKQYQPSGGKDSGGIAATYDYTGTGNPASTSNQDGTEKASLDYNSDGTVSGAASPNSSTNKTRYAYTDHQLTQITPKTGSSLGVQKLTYDAYGRAKTATDGRGITATYGYDKLDRLTSTSFSDGTSVGYGYDAAGRNSTRTDPNGTTTYGYDQVGRMTSRKNTFDGQTFSYAYNRAGWLTSSTSPTGGTISYAYDRAGKVTSMVYPYFTTTQRAIFTTDDHNRRTETWLGANADHTTWVAHTKYGYDKNGQVTHLLAEQGKGDTDNTDVVDIDYCYRLDVAAGDDCSGDGPSTTKLQWQRNNLTKKTVRYTYKTNGKLNRVYDVVSGTDPVVYDYAYDSNGNRTQADLGCVPTSGW